MEKGLGKIKTSPKFHFDNLFWENPQPYEEIILYQIGDISCAKGYEIGNHEQVCYEISYIVSGEGRYYINGKPYDLEKGDIFLCLPGEIHNGVADNIDPFRYYYLGFDFLTESKKTIAYNNIQREFGNVKNPVAKDTYDLDKMFMGIFQELINPKEYSPDMIRTYLKQIVILTYRNLSNIRGKEYNPDNGFKDSSKEITYQIINYIDMNLFNIHMLSEIGEKLGYNYSYLSHVFAKDTGMTIQEYFNKKKFEKAVELLIKEQLTVTEIAERLNYQSVHAFSKAFKNNIGVSPAQYLELYRKSIKVIR